MKKIIIAVIIVIVGGFLSYVGLTIANMDMTISMTQSYTVPEFIQLDGLKDARNGYWAMAVDGEPVIGEQNNAVRSTASTAKMILALAIMKKKPFNLGETGENITITRQMYNRYAWYIANNGSNTAVRVGEKISQYDALVSVLVASSNNMADSLAIWAFGSLDEYAKYATEMLAKQGITQTKIGVDASGYSETTVSTADELAKIGYLVLKNPVLAEIVAKKTAAVPVAGEIKNTNELLGKHDVVGIKTGYIGEPSGHCLVFGYPVKDHIVTMTVLGVPTRDGLFAESENLVVATQEKLEFKEIVVPGQVVGYYESWWLGKVPIKAAESAEALGWSGAKNETTLSNEELKITVADQTYVTKLEVEDFPKEPSLWQRFLHVFGWSEQAE